MMTQKIITIVALIILTAACNSQNIEIPYKSGDSYVFKVSVKDSSSNLLELDTLTLTIKKKGITGGFLGMNMGEWKSAKRPESKQERGVNIENDMVEIQTPTRYDYLENENIVIAGYPSFSKSMLVGYTSESKHLFSKSYGKLAENELEQYSEVLDSSEIKYKNEVIECKVKEYKNLNLIDKFGQYNLKTFYHKDYGFVKMYYDYPNGKKIMFELLEIKNQS